MKPGRCCVRQGLPLAEWLIEEGIGEDRAIRIADDAIIAARLHWPGALAPGQIEDAKLIARHGGSSRGMAQFPNGERALVNRLPRSASEGALLRLEITRSALTEHGRGKLAQARPTTAGVTPAPCLAEQLQMRGEEVRIVRRFPQSAGWPELWQEAAQAQVPFDGGQLVLYPTPAMTLIDIDGTAPSRELARAAVAPIASAVARFDIGGNIGIDFPTLEAKADRRLIDRALAGALADIPHEATAMNGFGFVQLVRKLDRPSLIARIAFDYPSAAARAMLRQAEELEGPGITLLRCPASVAHRITKAWLAELERRTGRAARVETDPALAATGWHAQVIGHD